MVMTELRDTLPCMPCLDCGRENPADASFCAGCGAPVERVCSNCGRANDGDARFCNGCAHPIGAAGVAPEPVVPRDYTPRHLAERILKSRAAVEGERKQVTTVGFDARILFAFDGRPGGWSLRCAQ